MKTGAHILGWTVADRILGYFAHCSCGHWREYAYAFACEQAEREASNATA